MPITNLTPASGSTHSKKRVGRGQGSGMGKTATRGTKGQKSRTGFKNKRGFEGGQQPLQKRLPKIGFSSRVIKPYTINVDKVTKVAALSEITVESIAGVHKMSTNTKKIKLIGKGANALASKVKDENVTCSGTK